MWFAGLLTIKRATALRGQTVAYLYPGRFWGLTVPLLLPLLPPSPHTSTSFLQCSAHPRHRRFPEAPKLHGVQQVSFLTLLPWDSWSEVKLPSRVQLYLRPVDCILAGSSVHGIFQARILEWVAISSFRGSSLPRDRTRVSCTAGRLYRRSH